MMAGLARAVVRFRILLIVVVLAVTGFLAYSIKGIRVETDMLESLPHDDPNVTAFRDVGKRYGGNYIAMVAVEADQADPLGVFSHEKLELIRKITKAIQKLDGVKQVNSLTNILDIKKTEAGLEVGRLLPRDRIPSEPVELKTLKEYTLSKDMYRNNLVSSDARYSVIVARLQEGVNKQEVGAAIKKACRKVAGGEKLYFGGIPMVMDYMNQVIYHDMSVLIPIVSVVVLLVLFLSFRTLTGVALPLFTVFLSVVWTLGLMALTGGAISMVSAIMPVVLIACGTAYGIHVVNKFYEDRNKGLESKDAVAGAISEVGLPLVMAALTTFIGFVSLLSADLEMIRDFGLYTALGIIAALVLSLTFVPALLSFVSKLPEQKGEHDMKREDRGILSRFTRSLAGLSLKRRKLIIVVSVILAVSALALLPTLKTEVNMTTYFKKGSEPRVAQELMEDHFGGATPVIVTVKGDMKHPAVVKAMRLLEQELDAMPHVSNAQSIAYLVAEMNRNMNDRFVIPETRKGLGNLWVFIDGNDILEQMLNSGMTEALVQAKVDKEDTGVMKDITARTSRIAKELSAPLFALETGSLPKERRPFLNQVLAARIAHRIYLDLASKGAGKALVEQELVKHVASALEESSKPDASLSSRVISMASKYIHGDEAEIELTQKAAEKAVSLLSDLAASGKFENKEIEKVLANVLSRDDYDSEDEYKEDLAYVPDMAESLATLSRELASEAGVERMMKLLEPVLPAGILKDKDMADKIKADLWEAQEPVLYLAADDYEQVTDKAPDPSSGVSVSMRETDLPLVIARLDSRLKSSQVNSLVLALFMVLLLLMVQLKSVAGGLVSMIPIVFTVLLNFAVMCILGVPLDNATMMVASVAIGVGIDYTIHFTTRFRNEFRRSGGDLALALAATLTTTGRAIVINSATVLLGFMVLMFSRTAPLQRFGWLTASTMLYSSLAAMILVPSVAFATGAKYLRRTARPDAESGRAATDSKQEN